MEGKQILVIGGDLGICSSIKNHMQNDNMGVYYTRTTLDAIEKYIKQEYCLVIINIDVLTMDIMDMIRIMRTEKIVPILILSEKLKTSEKIALLHAGADVCMEKPFNVEMCAAQVEALIQLYIAADINHGQHSLVIHEPEFIVSPRYRQVMVNGKVLELTRKEFDLLHYLASNPEQVFSWEQLYRHVWNNEPVIGDNDTVKVHISNIRKKISDTGIKYIYNVWGVGYKFSIESSGNTD